MNVMRNFTLRNLGRNKKRTIVTILGVIISVAMITAVTALLFSFVNYMQQGAIADGGEWHAQLYNVPADKLNEVTGNDKVSTAVLSREIGYAKIPSSENYSKSYLYLREYSANGFDQMSIRLIDGRLPQNEGEVLMSKSIQEGSDLPYAIGDTITLDVGDIIDTTGEPLKNNGYLSDAYNEAGEVIASPTFTPHETVTRTIVGIMETPGFEPSWSAGYGLLGYVDESILEAEDRIDVYVTMNHISRDIYKDVDRLVAGIGGDVGAEFNDELLRYYGVVEWDNVYAFLQGFMLVIILIIVIASVSLIYNAFAMSVSERARQLGLLASVGATRRQKRASVYFEGFFVGIIGIPVGILAGIGGIGITLAAIQPLLDSFINMPADVKLTLIVPPLAIGITVLFSIITIFVSVYRPARRASKISPIDAIRQTQEVRMTRRNVKTSRLTRALFGFEAEVAVKNLKRSRKKYRATVVSLVISLVLFLTVSSYANITRGISDAVNDGFNYDIMVQYPGLSEAQREDTNARIAALDLVDSFTASSRLSGFVPLHEDQLSANSRELMTQNGIEISEINDFNVILAGLDDTAFAAYADTAGFRAQDYADMGSPKGILINYGQSYAPTEGNNTKKIAGDVLTVRAGDTLLFTAGDPTTETSHETEATLTIGAVTQARPMGVLNGSFSSVTLVVTEDVLNSIVHGMTMERQSTLSEQGAIGYSAFMTSKEDQRLEVQISEITQSLPASGWYLYNIKDMARSEQNVSTFLGVFVYGFIILISLICIANIFNTVSTNIGLRRREFAMLRSVGMTPGGFNKMMRFESMFYGLKGLLYGLPISLAIAFLLYRMQINVLGGTFSMPWLSYGFAVLMILVIVFSTMLYATHRVRKENIIDALKDETF